MVTGPHITDITHVIQLAIAPVFLLTAVGTMIGVLSSRLSRVVDRVRVLEMRLRETPARQEERDTGQQKEEHEKYVRRELAVLARRMRLVYAAIGLAVICALFVSLLIALAFADAFLEADLSKLVGLLFIAAMIAFIGSLMVFLREIFLAINSARHLRH